MSGLVQDKDAILNSLDSVSALANETSDLAVGIRPAFVRDVKGLRQVAGNLNRGRSEIDRALQIMPIKLTKIGRTAINGSFFNFYLCQFQGNVIVAGAASCRSSTAPALSTRTRGVTSDEHALPRTQPGPDRGDQHRRAHRPAGGGLQRQQAAPRRGRRHLQGRLRRVRRPQARRRGADRRRPRRQGRRRGAQGRPRRGDLQGRHPLVVRHRDGRSDQGQDPAGRHVHLPRAGRSRPAQGGLHDPGVPDPVSLQRRAGLLRPGRPGRGDRRRATGEVDRHPGHADQGHPGCLPEHAARPVPDLRDGGQPQRADQRPAEEPRHGLRGAGRA